MVENQVSSKNPRKKLEILFSFNAEEFVNLAYYMPRKTLFLAQERQAAEIVSLFYN